MPHKVYTHIFSLRITNQVECALSVCLTDLGSITKTRDTNQMRPEGFWFSLVSSYSAHTSFAGVLFSFFILLEQQHIIQSVGDNSLFVFSFDSDLDSDSDSDLGRAQQQRFATF